MEGLTKRYRSRTAVDDLTVRIEPGRVTGFLGPNGSGKITTMRCVLGLTRPPRGTATVLGVPYADLDESMRCVGALIDPRARHPGRTARNHLLALAQATPCPPGGWTRSSSWSGWSGATCSRRLRPPALGRRRPWAPHARSWATA